MNDELQMTKWILHHLGTFRFTIRHFQTNMMATINKVKTHFANWREWELNPIVIKELRQGVRSWTVTGMLLLFLVVLFITYRSGFVDNHGKF